MTNRHHFLLLWACCIAGACAIIPYLYAIGAIPEALPVQKTILLSALQSALLYGLLLWITSWILPKTDLTPFVVANPWRQIILPGFSFGVLAGLVIVASDRYLFKTSPSLSIHPSAWAGALASLYGTFNEEVLLRLFLLTLIYFLIRKAIGNRLLALWAATILAALIFGLAHLPVAFKIGTPTGLDILRILFLNGFAGIVFGWLYWSKGFYSAAFAHFAADIVIHVLLV